MTFTIKTATTGIIIAGGLSSRFNINEPKYIHKALSLFRNMTLVDYIVKQLEPFCKEIVIVVNNSAIKSEFENHITCIKTYDNIKIVIDQPFAGIGPLRGLLTGFYYAKSQYIITTACDTLIYSDLVYVLVNYLTENVKCQASTVFYENGIIEPIILAINKKDAINILNILKNTERGRVTDLIRCLEHIVFFKLAKIIPNINFRNDLLNLNTENDEQYKSQIIKKWDFSNVSSKIFIKFIEAYKNRDMNESKSLLRQELEIWDNTPFKQLILHTLIDLQKLLSDSDPEMSNIKERIQQLREFS